MTIISEHRLNSISTRCNHPIIGRLFLETLINLEGKKCEHLNYGKFITNLYRIEKSNIIHSINDATFDSLAKTISQSDFEYEEDEKLKEDLTQYFRIKISKNGPLVFPGDSNG